MAIRRVTASLPAALVNGLLLGLAAVTLFPLVWMVAVSLMSPGEASTFPPPLLPGRPTLANYRELFAHAGMGRHLVNSVMLTTAVTLVSLVFNVGAGYGFAKLRFAGRDRIFKALLAALVIPSQVAMVPLFLLLKHLGLVNTYGGVIVPAMASIFGIFVVRQYALSIPDELLEAARMDGAGEFRLYWRIMLPLSLSSLAALATLEFTWVFNDYLWAIILISDDSKKPVTAGLQSLQGQYLTNWPVLTAGALLAALPTVVVFVALQRYFIQGLTMGSGK